MKIIIASDHRGFDRKIKILVSTKKVFNLKIIKIFVIIYM